MTIRKIEEKAAFLNILTKLFVDKKLSKLDVFVYATISYYLNLNEAYSKTCRDLAEEVSASKSAANDSLNKLIEQGYLCKIPQDNNPNKFLIVLPNSGLIITKDEKNLSTKQPRKKKSCPAERTNLSTGADKDVRPSGQKGSDTLYIKQCLNKQTNNKETVVCSFVLFDLEKHGFTPRIVNNMLSKYPKCTKKSLQESLEYFNYIINHTKHGNKKPLAVFRAAMRDLGKIDAPYGFKSQDELVRAENGHQDALVVENKNVELNKRQKQTEAKELKAFKEWKARFLDWDMELQAKILEPVEDQIQKQSESTAIGRTIIQHIREAQFRNYFLENAYRGQRC